MPILKSSRLEDERQALLEFIERTRPQGSLRNQVTIVFDGQGGFKGPEGASQIKIVFSQDRSADDKIKQLVQDAANKKTIVVVTDDREIRYAVRALGADVWSVKQFLSRGASPLRRDSKMKKKMSPQGSVKNISKTVEDHITSELEKVWLKRQ